MDSKYYIKNIINHDTTIKNQILCISDNIISDIIPWDIKNKKNCFCYAIPGFIDIHTHGGMGYELMDNSFDALNCINLFYLQNGTTTYIASTLTADLAQIDSVLRTTSDFMEVNKQLEKRGLQAKLLGIHLEGPWLSKNNLGAQNPDYCIVPGKESLELILKFKNIIKMVTFSYHTLESEKLLELLVEEKIVPACGHDDSYDERILHGFRKGIKVITHIWCASSTFHKRVGLRYLGLTEMGLMTDGIKVEVIADGKHITKYFWKFIKHNKKYEDILIVSDSIRCAGMTADPKIVYKLGEVNIIIDDGVAWLEDKTMFAGSIATMYSSFKRLVELWNVSLNEAVKITSYNQSVLFDIIEKVGEIKVGKIADIILLDEDLNIQKVIKSGKEVNI